MYRTSKWRTDFHKLIKSCFKIAYTSCIWQGISNLSIHDVKKYSWLVLNLLPNGFYSVLSYSIVRQSLFHVHSLFHTICDSNVLPYLNPLAGFDSMLKSLVYFLLTQKLFPISDHLFYLPSLVLYPFWDKVTRTICNIQDVDAWEIIVA